MPQSKDIYNTLILYYWGEKQEVTDYIAVDGCVKEEWKRQAQGFDDLPIFKKLPEVSERRNSTWLNDYHC